MKLKMRFIHTMLVFSVVFTAVNCVPSHKIPSFIGLDETDLQSIRKEIQSGKSTGSQAYDKLILEAGLILDNIPETVIDGDAPPSGNKHDFFAIGRLSFPNPETPDGLPYIRRDGITNPEADGDKYDLSRYFRTVTDVKTLSLAWFYSGNIKFAEKAVELLRVWFINPETAMNPHFEFASALPGVYNGMPIGIIFGVTLIEMLDYVKLLSASKKWSSADKNNLRKWFSALTKWLLESEFGKKEAVAKNNHGSWYAAQVAAYSLYTGEIENAKAMVSLARKQIDEQFSSDGSLPQELKRQRSLHYSIYGMQAFTTMALCAEKIGEDLWNHQTLDGRGLKSGYRFLVPYLLEEKPWAWTNIESGKPVNINALSIMRWAAKKYPSPEFAKTAAYLESVSPVDSGAAWLTGKTPEKK